MDLLSTSPDLVGGGMWMVDGACSACHGCGRRFTLTTRKHHCRVCGYIFCFYCSNHFIDPATIPKLLRTRHVLDAASESSSSDSGSEAENEEENERGPDQAATSATSATADEAGGDFVVLATTSRPTRSCRQRVEGGPRRMVAIPEESLASAATSQVGSTIRRMWHSVTARLPGTCRTVRVCRACCAAVKRANHSRSLIDVFSLNRFLSSDDYHTIACVCKHWWGAARTLRRTWKDMTSVFAAQSRDLKLQRRLLLQHQHQAPVRASVAILNARHKLRLPSVRFSVPQCLQVLMELPTDHAYRPVARATLAKVPPAQLLPFVNVLLILAADFDDYIFADVVLPAARADPELAFRCYYYVAARPHMAVLRQRTLSRLLSAAQKTHVARTEQWLANLQVLAMDLRQGARVEDLVRTPQAAALQNRAGPPVLLPGTAALAVAHVRVATLRVLSSASRPVVVQVQLADGKQKCIMIKRDPQFWNDVAVLNVHEHVAATCPGLRECISLYHVCPLSQDTGLVVFVDGAVSLFSLQERGENLLRHVVRTAGKHRTVGEMETVFRRSVAFSCIMALMLGYGDRHLGNLVIGGGLLLHIDYGFLLSREPDSKRFLPAPHRVRTTPEVLQAIGPEHYEQFLEDCTGINKQLRGCAHAVYFLLYPLVKTYVSNADIVLHLRSFVRPGSQIRHVDAQLRRQIRTATSQTTVTDAWVTKALDFLHRMGQTFGT
jgi:hypothetical protein